MEIKRLVADDNAVSPVIGVILMVAITVILAAVIATFVLGLGEQVRDSPPQATFNMDYDSGGGGAGDGSLTITHSGGATIKAENLKITGSSAGSSYEGYWHKVDSSYGSDSEISAGDSLSIRVGSEDTIRVVYTSPDKTDSATLRKWTGS